MGTYEAHGRRMREQICNAMVSLLERGPFTKITVQDILNEADIQRATFYRYFRDKYEVAEQINQSLAALLTGYLFDLCYSGLGEVDDEAVVQGLKYRKVIQRMIHVRVESVDLAQAILDAFYKRYASAFPDASQYECYQAGHSFLATVNWLSDTNADPQEIQNTLSSTDLLRWIARYYNINIAPDALLEFAQQPQDAIPRSEL